MREYKFRGKCVERDKWMYGYYVKGIQEDEAYILKNHNWLLGDDFIDVYPETVGQFTNLKDKNGKEIYEGDIVQARLNIQEYANFVVEFADGCFEIKQGNYREYLKVAVANRVVKIIGNIYENPELLNENG